MAYTDEHRSKFDNLKTALHLTNRTQLNLVANGGYTVLFTYPPHEESLYLDKAVKEFNPTVYTIIDVSEIFVEYIDEDGIDDFLVFYNSLNPTAHKAFFDTTDPHVDLFDKVVNAIVETTKKGLIPVLIRTGVFYGTGIENINLTQNKVIGELNSPIIIFYPGEIKGSHHHFLNAKQSSNYRCTII
jgi:hypothetical protein